MKRNRMLAVLIAISVSVTAPMVLGAGGYHLVQRISVPGDYGWDYMTVDAVARRLYVSHEREVVVIDTDSKTIVGTIPVTKGAHGTAIAQEFGRGFISKTDPGSVTIFDTKTLKPLDEVRVGDDPNCILYDPVTHLVFNSNGDGTLTVIEQETIDRYRVVENVSTQQTARTMAIDLKTHTAFLAAAEFEAAAPPTTAGGTPPRRTVKPASFTILVLAR